MDRKLIPNLKKLIKRQHGKVNYHLTQFFSGYGNFKTYHHRVGKTQSPSYQYGDSPHEDVLHTFLKYNIFTRERIALEMEFTAEGG